MKFPHFPLGARALIRNLFLAGAIALGAGVGQAAETDYPKQPVTIIVPFAPGGSLDATARVIAEKLRDLLGQPVLVVNRPGAGSAVGARYVAQAKPDGYTLFIASGSAFGFLNLIVPNFEYQLKDYTPLGGVAIYTSLFAVNASAQVKTLPELVKLAHDRPGGLSFCTTGVSGLNHLQLEMFKGLVKSKTGTALNVIHVPYNGVAPALTGLRAGEVQACALPYSSIVRNFEGNGIRNIAVQRHERLKAMPQVGTTGEQGYPEMDDNEQLVTLSAPAGTPASVVAKLEAALQTTMKDAEIVRKLNDLDVQPTFVGSSDARKWLEKDVTKFSKVIKAAGLTVQQ
ncbi:putative Bug-like extra-cytoplasmic solute receptor, TTT family [Variovorax paradoxus B4]|uniref:Putative Bug-like extra-cytoplasmic solute receptor, TTT family n=1 Tax=Variovorax paradoxus B4 TaxID=1246301 RepID=T1XLQ1_VARPD|nr:tripartite tricarboxylate transporter substrate binding protein [Variovorax paradoxus]AGU53528.1 putative Bug-like extra-cytoplasmic solute receptor, TTT family [Variovorax paradoxus B4]